MSNRDPHLGASDHREISLEGEVDDDFCAMMTEAYHGGEYRVVLQVAHFFAKESGLYNDGPDRYEKIYIADPMGDGLLLDGRMHGARMMPLKYEDEDGYIEFHYVPHAILSDVSILARHETEPAQPLADEDEKLLVPIESLSDSITLYLPTAEAA
jgi:hypothetical protein